MQLIPEKRKEDLKSICQALQMKRLNVFGSVVSEILNEESDIDF